MAKLTQPTRDRISATKFAFPKQRKEPLENASHVRNAVARFNQVKGVTEVERRAAWKRIQSAAKRYCEMDFCFAYRSSCCRAVQSVFPLF